MIDGKQVTVPQGKPIQVPTYSNSSFSSSEYLVRRTKKAVGRGPSDLILRKRGTSIPFHPVLITFTLRVRSSDFHGSIPLDIFPLVER